MDNSFSFTQNFTDPLLDQDEENSPQELFFKKLDAQRFRVEQRSKELEQLIHVQDEANAKAQNDKEKYIEAMNMLKSLNDKYTDVNNVDSSGSNSFSTCFDSIRQMKEAAFAERDCAEEELTTKLEEKEIEYKKCNTEKETENEREKLAASAFKELLDQFDAKKIRDRRYNIMKNRTMP